MLSSVDEKTCEVRHENVDKLLNVVDKRLGEQNEDISDIKSAVIKLTTLQELQTESNKTQTQTLTAYIQSLERIERRVDHLESKNSENALNSFMGSATGNWVIKVTVGIIVFCILTAIGQNVNPAIMPSLFGFGK
jgi:hypothetical protein